MAVSSYAYEASSCNRPLQPVLLVVARHFFSHSAILSNVLRTGSVNEVSGTPVAPANGRAVLLGSFVSTAPQRLEGMGSAALSRGHLLSLRIVDSRMGTISFL